MKSRVPSRRFAALAVSVFSSFVGGTALASTFTVATGSNTTLGTAQPISLSPNLIIHQVPPNNTLGSAQAVSPQYYGYDVLGNVSVPTPTEFFSFNVSDGALLSMHVGATDVANQLTELFLYDQNGNLVAIANGNGADGFSSRIDFIVPGGGGGTWTAEVADRLAGQPNPDFHYDLRFSSPLDYTTDVLGNLSDPTTNSDSGFYAINANVGDRLHLRVDAGDPLSQFPELLLYEPGGNLVAIANGNASNGSSSIIDFTIPLGAGGVWYGEVTGSPLNVNPFNYDLAIEGATGTGPINPLPTPGTVPEPSSLLLLAASLIGVVASRRRCKRQLGGMSALTPSIAAS